MAADSKSASSLRKSLSITVEFSVQYNLKITSVIYLFIYSNESGKEIARIYKKKASYLKQYHNSIIKTHIYIKMVKVQQHYNI